MHCLVAQSLNSTMVYAESMYSSWVPLQTFLCAGQPHQLPSYLCMPTNCHSRCLSLQVTTTLDKLAMRERFVNAQCEHLIGAYQVAREHLAQLQQQYAAKQDAATETENKLAQVTRVRSQI